MRTMQAESQGYAFCNCLAIAVIQSLCLQKLGSGDS